MRQEVSISLSIEIIMKTEGIREIFQSFSLLLESCVLETHFWEGVCQLPWKCRRAMPSLTWPSGWVKCLSHRTHERCLGACQPKLSSLMWNHPFLFSIHTPTPLPLYSLAEGGKFHRPKLAKCLPSVWPACILKHLKSESSAHLQELQTEGLLCGKKIF